MIKPRYLAPFDSSRRTRLDDIDPGDTCGVEKEEGLRRLDKLGEEMRGDDRLGTTWRGIGPAYEDKVRRIGFRIGDLQKPAFLEKKLRFVLRLKNETLTRLYGAEPFDEHAPELRIAVRDDLVQEAQAVRIVAPKGKANQAKYAAEVTATIIDREVS